MREEDYLESILTELSQQSGVDFTLYRSGTITRRMARRMIATSCASYQAYYHFLEAHPLEYEELLRDLTIKVSRFFRNYALFEALTQEIFPSLIAHKERNRDTSLRIWCAGCAWGQEVYSVTICLLEYLREAGKALEGYALSIFGTDIDEEALSVAARGVYDPQALRETPEAIQKNYFLCTRQTSPRLPGKVSREAIVYQVIDPVRHLVTFTRHDVTSETRKSPPAGIVANYDVIVCRNLLIYFTRPLQRRAFSNLIDSLNPGGFLILGKSESVPEEFATSLAPVNASRRIYRKLPRPFC